MQIVIPMSGAGQRFQRAGYRDIKPLIKVDGMPMIEHVIRMFPGESDFLFICSNQHLKETPLRSVLERLVPGAPILGIDPHKHGPVHAALQAQQYIKDEEPVVLNYCDFSVYWDYPTFKRRMEELNCAGSVPAYRGFHPHTLGPNLSEIGDKLGKDAIARTLVNPTSPMPSYSTFQQEHPKQFDQLVQYVASLKSE